MADDATCVDITKASSTPSTTIDIGPDFTACLPFGASLTLKNGKLAYKAPTAPAVSEGYVVTSGGCITGVKTATLPIYTGAACAPVPNDCGGSGGGSTISGLTSVVARGVSPITVTGNGTATSPLTIGFSGSSGTATKVVAGNDGIVVGSIASATSVAHKEGTLSAGTYGGLKIDKYGHIIGTGSTTQSYVQDIIAGQGITVTKNGMVYTVALAPVTCTNIENGTYLFGGIEATFDNCEITRLRQAIELTPQTVTLGDYDVTVNGYGSITDIKEATTAASSTSEVFAWFYMPMGSGGFTADMGFTNLPFTAKSGGKVLVEVIFPLQSNTGDTGETISAPTYEAIISGTSLRLWTMGQQVANSSVCCVAVGVSTFSIASGQHTISIQQSGIGSGSQWLLKLTILGNA